MQLKLFCAWLILVVILAAGWYPFKKRLKDNNIHELVIGETLATGIFLGTALMHMLPEATSQFQLMGYEYPYAYMLTGAVFLLFLWFEHLATLLYKYRIGKSSAFALVAWAMLSIHSLISGTALGLTQQYSIIIILFIAIIAHKWAESFGIAVQLNKSTLPTKVAILCFIAFALMTPIGIFIGWYFTINLESNTLWNPIMTAASAGTFLYLGTLHGLEKCVMVERCCNLRDFSYVICGFIFMTIIAIL